jgi:hypothetical protein
VAFVLALSSWLSSLLVVLPVLAGLATLLLAGLVTLALRILLLLTRLLTAALLLTGLLALLAGILVLLVRHIGGTPLLDVRGETTAGIPFSCYGKTVPRTCGTAR